MISRKNLARLSLISVKILLIGLLLLLPSFNSFGEEGSWSFAFLADTRSRIKDRPQGVNARILNLIAQEIALDVKDQTTNCELVLVGGDLILGQCSQKITQSNKAAYQQRHNRLSVRPEFPEVCDRSRIRLRDTALNEK